ncbi:ytfM [Wigglesworthia glossinidia endosymbiont of Glossina brevipalpis]|uniref:YtfM protein n=1 Tax=Wigglesworthia glossinidia brevipalpis TaxID=36870 RepID=Q8D271_WIGBR|nr:ytfM [Wigglesworthia glossinidia endosymbiont of Glossina brevipalpis]
MYKKFFYFSLSFYFLIFLSHGNIFIVKTKSSNKIIKNKIINCLYDIKNEDILDKIIFKKKTEKIVKNCLRSIGYYYPKINIKYSSPKKNRNIITIYVVQGDFIKMLDSKIILNGDSKNDTDYNAWIKNNFPKIGSQLNHYKYEKFKQGLLDISIKKGYFDADFEVSELQVFPNYNVARWFIVFNSGYRYRFGKINFYGSKIHKSYLKNISNNYYNKLYNIELISDLNNKLISTNWFNSVTVSPDIYNNSKYKNVVPLNVILSPNNKNRLEVGLGYNSRNKFHITSYLEIPWINSLGHSIKNKLYFSIYEKIFNLKYKIPIIKNPINEYYLLQSQIKNFYLNQYKYRSITFNISKNWNINDNFKKSINIYFVLDNYIVNNFKIKKKILIYPSFQINKINYDEISFPFFGLNQNYEFNLSNKIFGSSVNFFMLKVNNTFINTYLEKHRYIIRNNIGYIFTNFSNDIPSSMKFFAGGDKSIRGFKYKTLSSLDKDNNVIGSLKLFTISLEYQYNFYKNLWFALFVDNGDASDSLNYKNLHTGIGLGIRWPANFGTIKLDIAKPISFFKENSLEFYIGLGSEL